MTVLIYDIATKDRCNLLAMYSSNLGKLFPERWRRWDNRYSVSSEGRVYSKCHKKILKHQKMGKGYAGVAMWGSYQKIHPMVLKSFRPNPNPNLYTMCDHINQDRMDPRLENLRWSNVNLNALNMRTTKGYETLKNNGIPTGKFGARTTVNGKRVWLGTYPSKEECIQAYNEGVERAYEIMQE